MTSTINVTGPSQLIHSVPYLLGFQPTNSLVLIGLDDKRLVVTARVDLSDALSVTAKTLESMKRGGSSTIVAAVYGELPGGARLPYRDVVNEVKQAAGWLLNLPIKDVLYVHDERMWSYVCESSICCPPEGKPLDHEEGPVFPDTATPLASRADLEARVAPADDLVPTSIIEHWAQMDLASVPALLDVVAAIELAAGIGGPYSDDELARFGVAMRDILIRDTVWTGVDSGLNGEALWLEMARRLPAPFSAAPLFIYAWAAWRKGDGALARIAVCRVLELDPEYSAANLLAAALEAGMPPWTTPPLNDMAKGLNKSEA